ncbi:hypothetical protein C8A01DRAFT_18968, partial [Parachaetomium inaequale]
SSTEDSVGLIVWSSAEMAITLICIGIPVCRPLYKRAFRRIFGETSSAGYHKQSGDRGGNESNSVPLRTIGGGLVGADGKPIIMTGSKKRQSCSVNKSGLDTVTTCVDKEGSGSGDDISFTDVKLGVNGPFTRTTVRRGRPESGGGGGNASDEELVPQTARRSDEERERQGSGGGIMVTETYKVERSGV